MITKEEVLDYINSTSPTKIKQIAVTLSAMLNEKQLAVLDTMFRKKIDFSNPITPEKKEQKKEEPPAPIKENRRPTPSETMPKEVSQPPEPTEEDMNFDFDMNEDD